MKIVINLVLVAVAAFLGWQLYSSIKDPISFMNELALREEAVSSRLKQVRDAQTIYRDVSGGEYAKTFDELVNTLRNGSIPLVSVFGDPDDPNFDPNDLRTDTTYIPAIDTINALGINLDSLRYIPYSGGKEFDLEADTVTYQKALVNYVQVGAPYKSFMGPYASERYKRYINTYDPGATMKFGSRAKPTLSGSWD